MVLDYLNGDGLYFGEDVRSKIFKKTCDLSALGATVPVKGARLMRVALTKMSPLLSKRVTYSSVAAFSVLGIWYYQQASSKSKTMLPLYKATFSVPLTCESCIDDVSTALSKLSGKRIDFPHHHPRIVLDTHPRTRYSVDRDFPLFPTRNHHRHSSAFSHN